MNNEFDPMAAAREHYEMLLDTGSAESAKNIWKACDMIEQASDGKSEIRVADVGNFCLNHFGSPKPQSIRNQKNTLYKLVQLRSAASKIKRNGSLARPQADSVSDPNAAAFIRVLEERVRQLEASNNRLRQAIKSLAPLDIEIASGETGGVVLTRRIQPSSSDRVTFTDVEKEAVVAFLREQHLGDFGMTFDTKGRIVEGRAVFMEKPVITALRKILGAES